MPGNEAMSGQDESFAPGSVTLATVPGSTSILDDLPDVAFENLLVIAAGTTIEDVETAAQSRGHALSKIGVIPVSGTDENRETRLWASRRVDPSDLTGISIEVSRGMQHVKPGTGWVVVDSASVLAMYTRPDRLVRLLTSIAEATRQTDARFVISISADVLDDETEAKLAGVADHHVTFD